MPTTSLFNSLLHESGLQSIAENTIKQHPVYRTKIFQVERAAPNQPLIQRAFYAGVGLIPVEAGETAPHAPLEFTVSDKVIYRFTFRRGKLSFTERALQYDNYNVLKRAASTLSPQMVKTLDLEAHAVLNNATTAGRVGGWDRLSLSNLSHRLLKTSATYSNRTAPMTASMALLRVIDRYGKNIPDEMGLASPSMKATIYVPAEDESVWRQLLGSNTEAGQANSGVINPYLNRYEIVPLPWLDGTLHTAFVVYDESPLIWYDHMPIQTQLRTTVDTDVKMMVYGVMAGYGYGWDDARRVLHVPAQ
jgi:hypothetical protein